MKILLLNQTFHPDAMATSQQITDLALFLKAEGYEVSVLADRRGYENRKALFPPEEMYEGIRVYRVLSTRFGKQRFRHRILDGISFELLALWKLLFLPRQDVIISFTSPPLVGLLGAIYSILFRARSVQWLMDVNPDAAIAVGYLKEHSLPARFLVGLFEFSLRHSRNVVVLDRWMRERAIRRGAKGASIAIVPPWPAHEAEAPAADAKGGTKFRKAQGLDGKFVVLYSGNHSVVHPLDTLLEAAVRLKDDPDVVFLFIGGGLRVRDVTECVERHGLKNVVQLPHQPRGMLPETLACADLHVVVMGNAMSGLVHTSKLYGILATGIPYVFIGPKQSHVADLLAECPYGFHVEHGRVDDLVETIRAARALSLSTREIYRQENIRYVTTHYAANISLSIFAREVLNPMEPSGASKNDRRPVDSPTHQVL